MSEPREQPIGVVFFGDGSPEHEQLHSALAASDRFCLVESHCGGDVRALALAPPCDVIVSGLADEGPSPLAVLECVLAGASYRPVIVATARGSEEWAAAAIRRGAADYISLKKPGSVDLAIERIVEVARQRQMAPPRSIAPAGSDNRYQQLYSRAVRLLCVCTFEGYVTETNPVWDTILGYPGDELKTIPLRDLVHPDDRPKMAAVRNRLMDNECVLGAEVRLRRKDQSYLWIIWNAVPCVEQKVFFATAHDISQRKQMEEELRQSQGRLDLLAGATNEAVWDWDAQTGRVWRNGEFRRNFGGWDSDRGNPLAWWCERVHPDDMPKVQAYRPQVEADGRQHWSLEYRLRRLDDSYSHVYDRGFVMLGADGRPARMVGSLMDISALRQAEQKLQESDERFRLATKATCDAIWDWDVEKGQVWRSDGYRIFGYGPDDMDNDGDWGIEHIHPDDRERVLETFALGKANDVEERYCEYRFLRADGTYADVFSRAFVMLGPDGRPARMVGSVTDISERMRSENLSLMQRAELAHSARVRTIGEITAGVAHELNQPLTAIANYAESCAQAITSNVDGKGEKLLIWLDQIAASTQRAGDMIRRLRRFARKSEPRRSLVDVNELVQEVIDLLEAEVRINHVRIRWQPIAAIRATLDRVQVQQVMVNLLLNAFEAMADNVADDRQVVISARSTAKQIEIGVEDRGEGVSAENRDRVFDAFFTTKPAGVGIGLAISRSIVEDHGGRLWVDDTGHVLRFASRFRSRMPNMVPTVSVVDDDREVRESLATLIQATSLGVECYASGDEFLEGYQQTRPGCVVLDLRLPQRSGLEVLNEMSARRITVPVVMISGHGDVRAAVAAMKAGAVDFLEEPYRAAALLESIRRAIELDVLNRRLAAEKAILRERFESLSVQEREVLRLTLAGKPDKAIAVKLDVSLRTIQMRRTSLMRKMNARSRAELICLAQAVGI